MRRNLKQARTDMNLSQYEVANKADVSVQAVYQWEQGRSNVARKHWPMLSLLLNVSIDELEEILVQTLLDACMATRNVHALTSAQTSRLYRSDLLLSAIAQFEAWNNQRIKNEIKEEREGKPVDHERDMLEFERKLLERDKLIFELEKQVDELKREVSRLRPASSISSALNIEPIKHEVNHE